MCGHAVRLTWTKPWKGSRSTARATASPIEPLRPTPTPCNAFALTYRPNGEPSLIPTAQEPRGFIKAMLDAGLATGTICTRMRAIRCLFNSLEREAIGDDQ